MYKITNLFKSVFPSNCLLCDQQVPPQSNFCSDCYTSLPFICSACPQCSAILNQSQRCGQCLADRPWFDTCRCLFEFREPINSFIYKFKYHHQFFIGKILSLELATAIAAENLTLPDLVIPVPLHKRRLRQRGFNQSAVITRHVCKKLGLPFKFNYLSRQKYSPPQVELSARQRRQALNNAFIVNTEIRYQHIAIVDDVVTTTETVNQAAKALKAAGTEQVSVWSLARTP